MTKSSSKRIPLMDVFNNPDLYNKLEKGARLYVVREDGFKAAARAVKSNVSCDDVLRYHSHQAGLDTKVTRAVAPAKPHPNFVRSMASRFEVDLDDVDPSGFR